jgi:heme/copper-type cytochrome/quinol oxidase subunit 2
MREGQLERTDKRILKSEIFLTVFAIVTILFFILFPLFNFLYLKKLSSAKELFVSAAVVELGGFNPKEIKIKANQTLKLTLWALDVRHSFNLPQLGLDKVMPVGENAEVIISTNFKENENEYEYIINGKSFKFNKHKKKKKVKPLILEYKCNRYCSPQHWDMRGKLIILPPK